MHDVLSDIYLYIIRLLPTHPIPTLGAIHCVFRASLLLRPNPESYLPETYSLANLLLVASVIPGI